MPTTPHHHPKPKGPFTGAGGGGRCPPSQALSVPQLVGPQGDGADGGVLRDEVLEAVPDGGAAHQPRSVTCGWRGVLCADFFCIFVLFWYYFCAIFCIIFSIIFLNYFLNYLCFGAFVVVVLVYFWLLVSQKKKRERETKKNQNSKKYTLKALQNHKNTKRHQKKMRKSSTKRLRRCRQGGAHPIGSQTGRPW